MRLIDADSLYEELKYHAKNAQEMGMPNVYNGIAIACGELNQAKTIDAVRKEMIEHYDLVQVVRCKDCKHWLHDAPGCTEKVGHCEWANWMVGEKGFCVYGEVKDESI